MAQQPLTGRGLSQTILQPTDILGEAQARQQQEQMLAARQQAAQKPTKASRIDFDLEQAGNIYSGIYNEAYKQIEKFATDNADRLDEDSFFYDKELRRKFETTVAVVNSASSIMKNNDAIVREDFKDLSENQKSTSGALNLLENVAGLNKRVKVDFDNMDFGITGEDGSFQSYDQIEYITNPRGSYYRPQTWIEDLEGKLDKTFIDENGVREAYKEKIDGQIDIYFNNLDNSPDYQYSVIADYLQDSNDGIGIPDARKNALNIIRRLVESEDGTYTLPNGKVITREEALDWGKNQVKEAWYNKHGLSVDTPKGDGDTSYGDAASKLGMVNAEVLRFVSTGEVSQGVAIDGMSIDTPQGSKKITNLYIDPITQNIYWSGSEAQNETYERVLERAEELNIPTNKIKEEFPKDEYLDIITKTYQKATTTETNAIRSYILSKTGLRLKSTNELKDFIRSVEGVNNKTDDPLGLGI